MSSDQSQDFKSQAGDQAFGQAPLRKDERMNNSPSTAQTAMESLAHAKDQAAGLIQQTGMQVKNMAQGAAVAVKSTLGLETDNSPSNPSNPGNPSSNSTHPSLPGHPSTNI